MTTVRDELQSIISKAHREHFEDGMISRFEEQFMVLFNTYGTAEADYFRTMVLGVFFELLEEEKGDTRAEAVRIIARIEDKHTLHARLSYIHASLYHDHAEVRDAALLGVEIFEHWSSVAAMKSYIEWETLSWLKSYAHQVLAQFTSYIDEDMIRAHKDILSQVPVIEEGKLPLTLNLNSPLVDAIGVSLTESLVVPVIGKPPVISIINSQLEE